MASASVTDVLIIGGSHAGLSAALTLYRALRTSVIFDTHKPRNWYSSPRVKKLDNGLFQTTDVYGKLWLGRKLLLAIGVEDDLPNITGYKENYPTRIFPCIFQFGYEQRGAHSAGLLAVDGFANPLHTPKLADDAHKFTDVITIYTNANAALATELSQILQSPGILVDDREIACLVAPASSSSSPSSSSEIIIEFANGESMMESFLVHRPLTKFDHTLSDQLGLDLWHGGGDQDVAAFLPNERGQRLRGGGLRVDDENHPERHQHGSICQGGDCERAAEEGHRGEVSLWA